MTRVDLDAIGLDEYSIAIVIRELYVGTTWPSMAQPFDFRIDAPRP